jgi:hypothetical protein
MTDVTGFILQRSCYLAHGRSCLILLHKHIEIFSITLNISWITNVLSNLFCLLGIYLISKLKLTFKQKQCINMIKDIEVYMQLKHTS